MGPHNYPAGEGPLTGREELFVLEYLKDCNALGAARRAGYSPGGVATVAPNLMARPRVQRAIQAAAAARMQRLKLDADEVLREILAVATFDLLSIVNDDGTLVDIVDMPAEARKAISSIEVNEIMDGSGESRVKIGETKKVKFWDRLKAQEMLARHLSLLTDNLNVSGDIAERIVAARQRVGG